MEHGKAGFITIRLVGGVIAMSVLLVLGFLSSQVTSPIYAEQLEEADVDGGGVLDGMTFSGEIGYLGKPARAKDQFIFSDGRFASSECVKRCGYEAAPYFVRQNGAKTEFISISRCNYKDAKIVWRGTVENGIVKGESHWTVKRWYRTVEQTSWFEGKLVETPTSVASQ